MRLAAVFMLILGVGCAPVAPWERETLASERMRLDGDPDEEALSAGRQSVREEGHVGRAGSSSGGAAGGCGCN